MKITRVAELGGAPFPSTFMFPEATPELVQRHAWLRPHFAHEDGRLFGSIHSFVIESANGASSSIPASATTRRARSRRGICCKGRSSTISPRPDTPRKPSTPVLCTHLHVDHVGWNTRLVNGKWVPTFPNARYLFGRKEWEHWSSAEAQHRDGDVMGDSVRPIIDAGLAELVDMNHALTPEVRLEPTPGHTPGHVSVRISSRGEEAVITGDLMHHPLQCAEPDLANNFDVDAAAARRTRRDFLSRYSNKPVLVLGTHFAPPTGGWVVDAEQAWRFDLTPPADAGKT